MFFFELMMVLWHSCFPVCNAIQFIECLLFLICNLCCDIVRLKKNNNAKKLKLKDKKC